MWDTCVYLIICHTQQQSMMLWPFVRSKQRIFSSFFQVVSLLQTLQVTLLNTWIIAKTNPSKANKTENTAMYHWGAEATMYVVMLHSKRKKSSREPRVWCKRGQKCIVLSWKVPRCFASLITVVKTCCGTLREDLACRGKNQFVHQG